VNYRLQITNYKLQIADYKLSAGGSTKGGFASGEGSAFGGQIICPWRRNFLINLKFGIG